MAVDEYRRKLEIRRQKYAFGKDLLDVIAQDSTPKELQDMCTAAGKMAKKIGKIEAMKQDLAQEVLERRREIEEEMRSQFVEATGQDRDPDPTVLKEEIDSVSRQVKEIEKNCTKLIKEKKMLDHDRLYHKVFQGIAPIHFDKKSTDSHVKGCIPHDNGVLCILVSKVHISLSFMHTLLVFFKSRNVENLVEDLCCVTATQLWLVFLYSQCVSDITKKNGELYAFEFDLDKEDSCTVADTLWDNL